MSSVATTPLRHPPGPQGLPVLGLIPYMRHDPLRFFLAVTRRYGDVISLGNQLYVINHPDYLRYVLQDNNSNYVKGPQMNQIRLLFGNSLLSSEGQGWLQQRRVMQPIFHRQRIAAFATTMTDITGAMLERWQHCSTRAQPVDIHAEMMQLTMKLVCKTLLSIDVGSEAHTFVRAIHIALGHVEHRRNMLLPLPVQWPTPSNLRFRWAVGVLDDLIYRLIAERQQSDRDTGDLLSLLVGARDETTGMGMTDRQLRDEVLTVFIAGHETTALALTWTCYLLSLYPNVERQLHAELEAVLAGRTPTVSDLPQLRYTRQVLEEALRLYPPAWLLVRSPLTDDVIGGYTIPAGVSIFISPYTMHRHPAFWDNPEGFDPDRFSPEQVAQRPRFAYLPFGGGPRLCIGNNFAMMEMVLILAMLYQRYRLHLVSGFRVEPKPQATLLPRNGLLMTIHRR